MINGSLKILMVEDSENDAAYTMRTLEKAGFDARYEIVTSGPEMKAALSRQRFDVVLSDHNLPQFDSARALEVFKASGLDGPFIIVSGAIGEETAVNLMKNGAQDYVMKSNLDRLAPVVERELQDAEIRRQRKESARKLLVSEERFRQVAEVAGEMIWEVDASIRYRYVSPIAESVTGYTVEEIVGKMTIYDLFPPENRRENKAVLEDYFKKKQTIKAIASARMRKDGRKVILETSATPILDPVGDLLGYRGTDTDITERRRMETEISDLYQKEKSQRQKLQEEAEVKNLFINVLAHELRNPLTAIVVSSDMLKEEENLKEEIKRKLTANINDSAKILTRRLEELLDLARYSKGAIVLNKSSVNIAGFLQEVVSRFSPNLEQQGQILKMNISPQLGNINVDESRLDQVITNLLSNASKYSPPKSEIVLGAHSAEGGIIIETTDKGIGIAPEEQKKLFQPYHRAGNNHSVPGIGLGLAISNKIVEAHGGNIQVQSQLGQGSTFSVFIPG